jgi:hypothetical protein
MVPPAKFHSPGFFHSFRGARGDFAGQPEANSMSTYLSRSI